MGNKLYEENNVKSVANAIRAKNGAASSDKYLLADMDVKIAQLPSMRIYERNLTYNAKRALEAVFVAQTYLDHAAELIYKAGNYGAFHDIVFDESGKGYIDCSTFAGLVLRGIPYEKSPYNGYERTARTDLYAWADRYLDKNNIRWANELAEYFFKSGRAFTDPDYLMPGDIIFHAKKDGDNAYFGNVWHVSICMEVGGGKMAHALYGGAAVRTYSIGSADCADWMFFARPDYAAEYSDVEPEEPDAPLELKILVQPTDQSGAAGSNAVFTVLAQGEGLAYQWQFAKAATPNNWQSSSFEGYNTNTQTVGIESFRNGDWYRCMITDTDGNTVTSNAAKIIMTS